MFYREAGDFKTTYPEDAQTFPIQFDRMRYHAVLAIAFGVIPFFINDYWANAVFVPFLIYAIAAIGLNILTGYCGQVSLGTGGFMAVGAYACYKLMTGFPEVSILIHVLLAGGITACVGVLFGLPSLRIKGFYLAVATLAAQFFLVWLFNKVPWFYNYSASGQINAPERTVLGHFVTGPNTSAAAKYLFCLIILFALAWVARNLTRGAVGRKWMAIRDRTSRPIPIDSPGQEQKSQWLQIRREKPDYVLFWGWGVMNQVAVQEAANIRFPMENMIGVWWSGSENDVTPAGAAANGYKSLAMHGTGMDYPV